MSHAKKARPWLVPLLVAIVALLALLALSAARSHSAFVYQLF